MLRYLTMYRLVSVISETWVHLAIAFLWVLPLAKAVPTFPTIMVVSMDAFRPDYVDACLTPTITRLRSSGVYAPFMRNVFPTKTFPNHHSIATGVHPDVHGVLDTTVYAAKDGCSNRTIISYSYDLFHYNNDVIPIWILNQLSGKGRHSGVMMWPGGEFSYGCKKTIPTFSEKYDPSISFQDRIDTVISWIKHPKTPANLVMLYLEEPDLHGHAFGIDSPEVRNQIKKLDKALDYIEVQLEVQGLKDHVTVFVVSDHGMINQAQKNIIDLSKYVDDSLFVQAGLSPVLQVFPYKDKESNVLSGLLRAHEFHGGTFDVYTRDKIPSEWHYAKNNRTPPILVVAKEGFVFQDFYKTIDDLNKRFNIEANPRHKYGTHGYSNFLPSMNPFFFAWGPLVKSGVVLDPFNTTELYPLWAHVLNLKLEHEIYSFPNLSMLFQSHNDSVVARTTSEIHKEGNGTSPLHGVNQHHGGTPLWMYWFSGLIAAFLLVIITGIIVYYCRDLQRGKIVVPPLPQNQRSVLENQHLLVSESDDDLHL